VAEELAEGFFRAIFAGVRAIAGFFVDVLRDVVGELLVRGVLRLFAAFVQLIGYIIELALRAAQVLHFVAFRRPVGKRTLFVHATAIALLAVAGFYLGATASILYHANWGGSAIVASTAVER